MNIIVCLDDRDGLLFNGRRQSKDSLLRRRVQQIVGEGKLWMNSYSIRQFDERLCDICVDDAFLQKAGEGDYCFLETADVANCLDRVESVIIYRWNRTYPSDVKFPIAELLQNRHLTSRFEFPGSSHKMITEEVYSL